MSDTASQSPYMTTKELAEILHKTPAAIWQMRHRGQGPKGVRVGRQTLYRRTVVAAWLAAREEADPIARRAA